MSGPPVPGIVSVRGGAGGLVARSEDLRRLASLLGASAAELAERSAELHLDLLACAEPGAVVFDPVGAAEVFAALFGVADGPNGLSVLALCSAELAAQVAAAGLAYTAAENAVESSLAQAFAGLCGAPTFLVSAGAALWHTGSPLLAVQAGLIADPALVDTAVDTVSAGHPAPVAAALGQLFRDGRPVVSEAVPDPGADVGGPPRGVGDLMAGLSRRNDGQPGEIDVRVLTTNGPGGQVQRSAVVDIPGTKDWSLAQVNPDVTNLGTNLLSLAGVLGSYELGVFVAMRRAGVQPGDPVLFVGHSQGGMVALAAARDAERFGFRAGGVLTAAAPTGLIPAPRGVPVMSLENAGDIVPHLDGRPNPDSPDAVTVTVHRPSSTIVGEHSLISGYVPAARDVDASQNPSIGAVRRKWGPFLQAESVQTTTFVVTRATP